MTNEIEQNKIILEILKNAGLIPLPDTKTLKLHYKNIPEIVIKNVIVDKTKTVAMFTNPKKKLPIEIQLQMTEFDITKLTAILYFLIKNNTKKISIYYEPNNPMLIITDTNIGIAIK